MKNNKKLILSSLALCISSVCYGAESTRLAPLHGPLSKQTEQSRYIVLFKQGDFTLQKQSKLARQSQIAQIAGQAAKIAGVKLEKSFQALPGFIASGSKVSIEKLRANPQVELVQLVTKSYLPELPVEPINRMADQNGATWGLDRIDQRELPLNSRYHYDSEGNGVNVYVMDTGINPEHEEFVGRVKSSWNFYNDNNDTTDCHGHGTHVAGTIGGTTYGVAKNAILHSVKVYGCANEPTTEDQVVTAMDWVAANAELPAVANLSLSVEKIDPAMDAAVRQAVANGVTVVVAAGNDNDDACKKSPAKEPLAITVGSSTSSDRRSGFSSYGTCVDIFAPGSSVKSAWHTSNTATNTISGTSMATPHVAGIVALYLSEEPSMTPAEVEQKLLLMASRDKLSGLKSGDPNLLAFSLNDEPTPDPVTDLKDGVAVNVSGASKSDQFFKIAVPEGATKLTFTSNGNNGDLDLYAKFGSKPSNTSYECKSTSGNSIESCAIDAPQVGDYYLLAHAYSAFNDATITATISSVPGSGGDVYNGNLSGKDDSDIQPDGRWFQYNGGLIRGVLAGPNNADFDLKLEQWKNGSWSEVARAESSSSNEEIEYDAPSGYYRFKVYSYSGSGDYQFTIYK